MKLASRFTISAAMLTLALGSTPLMAQQPAERAEPQVDQAPKPQTKSIMGELLRVDVEKQLVRIKAADDKEMEFKFTADTEVTGESKNVEGLATKTGTKVSVDYTGEGSNMVATKIAIQPSDSERAPAPPAPAPSTPAPQPTPQP